MSDLSENPITDLLRKRERRQDEAHWTFWALLLFGAVFVPLGELPLIVALSGFAYGLVRASLDGRHLASWSQGRRLEEMLLSNLTPTHILDGLIYYSLGRTRQVALLLGIVNLGAGLLHYSPGYLWAAVWEPALLLALVFSLVAMAAGPSPWSPLTLVFGIPASVSPPWTWPIFMGATLVAAGFASREEAGKVFQAHEERPRPKARSAGPGRPARLWSDNPIVVRELRRQARGAGSQLGGHSGFVLMLLLLCAHLGWGQWDAVRYQINACYIVVALLILQGLRAALATCAAVVQEREAGSLETLALSGLSARAFVDGWAQLGWRPRLLEVGVAAPIALVMALRGVQLAHLLPAHCSLRPQALFTTAGSAVAFLLPLAVAAAVFTVALTYLGLLCSAHSQKQSEAVGSTLFMVLALALGLTLIGGIWGWGSLWWLCLAAVVTGGLCRWLALAQLKQ